MRTNLAIVLIRPGPEGRAIAGQPGIGERIPCLLLDSGPWSDPVLGQETDRARRPDLAPRNQAHPKGGLRTG